MIQNASEPSIHNQYVFAEFPSRGRVYHASLADLTAATTEGDPDDLSQAIIQELAVLFDDDDDPLTASVEMSLQDIIRDDPNYGGGTRLDLRFGQGPAGEVYILNKRNGWIYEITSTAVVPGDANGDRLTWAPDYTVWANNFGMFTGNANPSDGDFNGDGFVSEADYTVWANNFGAGPVSPVAVPEPGGLILLAIGLLGFAVHRRRL